MNELELQITAALGRDRAPFDGSRSGSAIRQVGSQISQISHAATWEADYGLGIKTTTPATVDAARLQLDGGGYSDGSSGPQRKSRLDNGGSWFGKALWNEMIAALCPGTRNLFIGVGVLAFIIVV